MEYIPQLADRIHGAVDQNYEIQKQQEMNKGKWTKIGGIVIAVAAVALLILGIALCATGNLGGIACFVFAAPVAACGHTVYVMGNNLQKMAQNPKEYRELGGLGKLDQRKFTQGLWEGTLVGLFLGCLQKNVKEKDKMEFIPPQALQGTIWGN